MYKNRGVWRVAILLARGGGGQAPIILNAGGRGYRVTLGRRRVQESRCTAGCYPPSRGQGVGAYSVGIELECTVEWGRAQAEGATRP